MIGVQIASGNIGVTFCAWVRTWLPRYKSRSWSRNWSRNWAESRSEFRVGRRDLTLFFKS
jgi:hypothetical protein